MFYNDRIALQGGVTDALCPECSAKQPPHPKTKLLIDCVPETELSRFIEAHLQTAITRYCAEHSAKYNSLPEDMMKPEDLSVRVVLSEVGVVRGAQQ